MKLRRTYLNVAKFNTLIEATNAVKVTFRTILIDFDTKEYIYFLVSKLNQGAIWKYAPLQQRRQLIESAEIFTIEFFERVAGWKEYAPATEECLGKLREDRMLVQTFLDLFEKFGDMPESTSGNGGTNSEDMLFHCYFGGGGGLSGKRR